MRTVILLVISAIIFGLTAPVALASEQNTGYGVTVGYSLAAGNDAVEDIALGVKYRLDRWEAAFEVFRSEFEDGDIDRMGVLSVDYTWDFARIPEENYGIYAGSGFSYLGAADVWDDGFCWNILLGYDYTASVSLAGRFFYTLDGGEMFAIGGFTYLF